MQTTVNVCGVTTEVLLDGGARLSCTSEALLENFQQGAQARGHCPLPVSATTGELRTRAAWGKLQKVEKQRLLPLQFGAQRGEVDSNLLTVRVAVLKDLPCGLTLGRDFLRGIGFEVNHRCGKIKLDFIGAG